MKTSRSYYARAAVLLVVPVLIACADRGNQTADTSTTGADAAVEVDPQVEFWNNLLAMCDLAFAGQVVEAPQGDTTFVDKQLVMHVRLCSDEEIRIPFHVGEDRSRTWVLTRNEIGLVLKHDHRHEDGQPDARTLYGGETATAGEPTVQEFPADAYTAELIPEAATNVWTLELVPGDVFVYALRREGTDRRYRIEFDLTRTVPAPPAPWGEGR